MHRREFLVSAVPAAALTLATSGSPLFAAGVADAALVVTPLAERMWQIRGAGGNVTLFHSPQGALLVDGGAAVHSTRLMRTVHELTGLDRVHTLFNTHWHADQTGSNLALGSQDTRIIAHENTRLWLTTDVEVTWEGRHYQPLPKIAQPNKTFYTQEALQFGGEQIEYGHLGQAHTDGDIYVFFRNANVLVAGDVVSVGSFPIPDYCSNGWIGGLGTAVQTLVDLCDERTQVVPGLGATQGVAHLRAQHAMLVAMRQRLSRMMADGFSAQEMIDARPAQEFEAAWGDPTLFIRNAYPGMSHRTGELGVSIV